MSRTQYCRSRCRSRPISVHVSHGEGSDPASGCARRNRVRSEGSPSLTRPKASSSRTNWAFIAASQEDGLGHAIIPPAPTVVPLVSLSGVGPRPAIRGVAGMAVRRYGLGPRAAIGHELGPGHRAEWGVPPVLYHGRGGRVTRTSGGRGGGKCWPNKSTRFYGRALTAQEIRAAAERLLDLAA